MIKGLGSREKVWPIKIYYEEAVKKRDGKWRTCGCKKGEMEAC